MTLSTSEIERSLEQALLLILARHERGLPTRLAYLLIGQLLRIPQEWLRPVPTSSGYQRLAAQGLDRHLLTDEELQALVPTEHFFENEVRQAVRHLRDRDLLESPAVAGRGTWRLTMAGRGAARDLVANVATTGSHEHYLLGRMVQARRTEAEEDAQGSFSGPLTPERILRSIILRRGQPEFRDALIEAYSARCAVTSDNAVEALEAAHITPVSQGGVFEPRNGLLLRADVHTLFDLDLWAVHPGTRRVHIASSLMETSYASLEQHELRLPSNSSMAPAEQFLRGRWERFERLAG